MGGESFSSMACRHKWDVALEGDVFVGLGPWCCNSNEDACALEDGECLLTDE